jgi:hypothetical protein
MAAMSELDLFASNWYFAALRACQARDGGSLLPLLTAQEPYRASAVADTQLLARLVVPMGLAMQVRASGAAPAPFGPWQETIHRFEIELRWQDTMDPQSGESTATMRSERIVHEHGEWRVAVIFDDESRGEAELLAEAVAQQRAR